MKNLLEFGLWALLALGTARAATVLITDDRTDTAAISLTSPTIPAPVDAALARTQQMNVAARNPFRLNRAPSQLDYGAESSDPGVPSYPITLPPVRLSGIVGGPSWRAILEGVPGQRVSIVVFDGAVFGDVK